jgi:hypothetical protein
MTIWIKLGLALATLAGIGAAFTGTYYAGHKAGRDACEAKVLDEERVIQQIRETLDKSIAAGLANIKVENRTIMGRVEREIRTNTVYADCRHPDGVLRDINEALGHRTKPAADRVVPAPDAAR